MGERVVLAMSGGVDSSVCAHLLVEQGYEVIGLFMRTGAHADDDDANPLKLAKVRGCCSAIDAADAQRVADRLGIRFYALDFQDDFARIKDYFADEYQRGRTPNPCVVCNTWLKFGKLRDYARVIGADRIATGHYARVVQRESGPELHRAVDRTKDQSYFLYGVGRETLASVLFPIGELPKTEVRERARSLGLGVHDKPDSQEICFVPSGDYASFLRGYRPEASPHGELIDERGHVVGEHAGIENFTIGQRKGLGVALGSPRYVVKIEPYSRRVHIGPRELLERRELTASGVNWLTDGAPAGPIPASVKIRYLHEPAAATVEPLPDGGAKVAFETPQSAITPGQATVFYDQDRVLGGGWIDS